jgi:2-polyprenyl-6-methoxyphenol hydroxylase-like FAD-dependent oxidoreductase
MPMSTSAAFDVIVVGGGPAGAAAAIALAQRGISVAIVERAPAPRPRVGETLPPMVRIPLERLGLWERFRDAAHEPAVGNRSFWGSDAPEETHFIANPYGAGWHIDRPYFEQMLLDGARACGVRIFAGRQLERVSGGGPDGWTLGIPEPLTARFIVDASGRASLIARMCGVRRVSIDRLVGATMFLEPIEPTAAATGAARVADPHGAFTLIEATADGWWYSAPLPGGRLVVACMTDADIAARATLRDLDGWLAAVRQTTRAGTIARVRAYAVKGTPRLASANTSRLSSVIGPSWLAVGDAAVSFDPLSSQGLVTGLECAIAAADAIESHRRGDETALPAYARMIVSRYRQYVVERAQFYGVERRWPESAFWQRRQLHLDVKSHATA